MLLLAVDLDIDHFPGFKRDIIKFDQIPLHC